MHRLELYYIDNRSSTFFKNKNLWYIKATFEKENEDIDDLTPALLHGWQVQITLDVPHAKVHDAL